MAHTQTLTARNQGLLLATAKDPVYHRDNKQGNSQQSSPTTLFPWLLIWLVSTTSSKKR